MMNNHIVSFLDGIAKGDASIGVAPCPRTVKSDSLTVSPLPFRSQPHAHNKKQIEPENSHEMPVDGSSIKQALAKPTADANEPPDQVDERGNSAEKMQRMHGGKHVKEGAIGIRGKIESVCGKIPPSQILPGNKGQAQEQRSYKPGHCSAQVKSFRPDPSRDTAP